ncbi:MAG: glycosyltransferase, partial [Promethearchaeota archaeon]
GPLKPEVERLEEKFPTFLKYLGYLNKEELGEALKRNDILLFSSRKEPFGRVIIESLVAEQIVICTPTVGSVEILRGKEFAFFLKKLDIKEFKESIMRLYKEWIENPEKIRNLQKLASQYALDKYSISREIKMFKDFIDRITKTEE